MSTIKTFGAVDQRSLEQLKRCMEAGDAEFGVLCADHHPGYSQPIGGGIAYEGYVSPSGVGYDIGCGNKAAQTDLTREDLDALGGVEPIMDEITRRISFGMGVPAQERDGPSGARGDPDRRVRAAAQARPAGRVAARHGRLGQPLRQPDGGRGQPHLGRRPLRLARLRPQDGVGLPRARAGPAVRRSSAGGRDGLAAGAVRGRLGARRVVRGCDAARGRLRLRGPRHRRRQGARDPGRDGGARGAQPPQLRVAGGALRPHLLGDPEGLHAGPPGPGGLRRRLDGRRVGDPRGRRVGRERAGALLDRARRRPGDEPVAGRRPGPAAEALRVPDARLRSRLRHRRHQLAASARRRRASARTTPSRA